MKTLIYYYLALLFLVSCGSQKVEEIILIPKNYTGKVVVIFNQKNGAKKQYRNNKRLYVIPSDGVLLTQFKEKKANYITQYYIGNDKQFITTCKDNLDKRSGVIICNEEYGVMGNSDDKKSLRYFGFYVGKQDSIDAFYSTEYENKFNHIIKKKTGYDL